MTRRTLTDAALSAASRDWPVFPLLPGSKRPRAELTDWESKATLDRARITRWWDGHPNDNVAIATGPAQLVVVDLDRARPGENPPAEWPQATSGGDVLAQVADRHGQPVPATWTVATPSGGRHLYYLAPEAPALRNTAGRIGWKVDTRAAGGYVVAPGSAIAGRPYLVVDERPPCELPRWLADLLQPEPPLPTRAPTPCVQEPASYAIAALDGEVGRVLTAPPGTRNASLNVAAWNLARLIGTGILDRTLVEDALCEAGRKAGGQTPAGVAATVRSAINARLRRGARRPAPATVPSIQGAHRE